MHDKKVGLRQVKLGARNDALALNLTVTPEGVKALAEQERSEVRDTCGSGLRPEHARLLESLADDDPELPAPGGVLQAAVLLFRVA